MKLSFICFTIDLLLILILHIILGMPQEIHECAFVEPALHTMTSQEEIFIQRVKEDVKRMTKDNQSISLLLGDLVSEIPKPFWLKGMEHRHKARKYKGEDMSPRTMTSNAMQSFEHQICLYGKLRHNWGIILLPKITPAMALIIPKRILISRLTCELKWAGEHCQRRREKNHFTAKTCFLLFSHILCLFWLLS